MTLWKQKRVWLQQKQIEQKLLTDKLFLDVARLQSKNILWSNTAEALEVLQTASQISRIMLREKFEIVVSNAIEAVTGIEHEFGIELQTHGDEIKAVFTLDGNPHILDSFGGGIADIIVIILRFLRLNLQQTSCFLLLDEPTRNLHSKKYSMQIGTLLKELSKTRQIIVSTYSEEIAAMGDRIIRTKLIDDRTVIEVQVKENRHEQGSDNQ